MRHTGQPTVLFISAGMLTPKKGDHPFARWHLYLNYGLVGLATVAILDPPAFGRTRVREWGLGARMQSGVQTKSVECRRPL